MRKALKRAAHVLMAAGALGLVRPAIAQTSATPAKGSGTKAASGSIVKAGFSTTTPAVGDAVSTSMGKLEEVQVELALLNNPSTFAYALGCKHTGVNLELRGYVPNNLIKGQALEIARKHCSVPVLDKLQLHNTLTLRSPAGTVDELQQGAATLLAESFGDAAVGLEIKAAPQGQIVVNGSCDSYEQKLAVSKKLRALHGCCFVENRLEVKSVLRDGKQVTLVSADGAYTISAGGTAVAAEKSIQPVRNWISGVPVVPPIATAIATQQTTTPPLAVAVAPSVGTAPTKTELPPWKTEMPVATADKVDLPPVATAKKVDVPPMVPTKKIDLPPVATTQRMDVPPLATAKKVDVPPVVTAKKIDTPPAVVSTDLAPLVKKPDVTSALPPVKPDVPSPFVRSQPPPVATPLATTSPLANVSAYAKPPANNNNSSDLIGSLTAGGIGVHAKEPVNNNNGNGWQAKPTDPVARVSAQTPAVSVKTTTPPGGGNWPAAHETHPVQVAYATSGVVLFDEEALPEPPAALANDKAAQLKQKVAALCGARAKEVVVESRPDGLMHVTVNTVSATENEELTFKLLTIPEMASPNVKLHVQLAR